MDRFDFIIKCFMLLKGYFFILFVLFGIKTTSSQTHVNLSKIDSLHTILLKEKNIDSAYLAKVHYTIGELFRYSNVSDSAYYYYNKSGKFYKGTEYKLEYAKVLYGLTVVQSSEKDYTGSEAIAFQGISILESLPSTNEVKKYTAYLYNVLGLIFKQLNQFDTSIKYYKKSIALKKSLKGNYQANINNSINNLAFTYNASGDYTSALKAYKQLLSVKNFKKNDPSFYALVLGNYAYNLYLSKRFEKLPDLYFEALNSANQEQEDSYEAIIIYQYLSEYYHYFKKAPKARFYAHKAKKLAESFDNVDLLKSLLLLSKVEEGDVAFKYLKDYVVLNDSLNAKERAVRNKFERIRFETKQLKKQNIQISKQRLWLLIISGVLVITSFIIYIIVNKRHKKKELDFMQKQQQANEEIYNLMLAQNSNIEEARVLEKQRISKDLHDGILGRLFGTRLSLDSLNMGVTAEIIKTRSKYIISLKDIEDDIRKVSHELNTDFVSGSGFVGIIKNLIETQCIAYKLDWQLKKEGDLNWDIVSNKNKVHIYRIIQEALHNIYKHAKAQKVSVIFKRNEHIINLEIVDNGIGFDLKKVRTGIGLKNINSRVLEINGQINIVTEKNNGTKITIAVPMGK